VIDDKEVLFYSLPMKQASDLHQWLQTFLTEESAVSGTIHLRKADLLHLEESIHIPEQVLAITRTIPCGKGMAGLAWERNRPVTTCNLKEDTSGDVRPGAKAVQALAAVALPVCESEEELRAVVGIAWKEEKELDEATLNRLLAYAATLP
jgi:L-methionine (R)-S-oxide reductase